VVRRGAKVLATGSAAPRARLTLRLSGCRNGSAARTMLIKADRKGRFARRLGSAKRLRACRVTLKVAGRSAVARAAVT